MRIVGWLGILLLLSTLACFKKTDDLGEQSMQGLRLNESSGARPSIRNESPPSPSEPLALIRHILAEQERVGAAMSGYDYRVLESRQIANSSGQAPLVLDRTVEVTQGVAGSMLVVEEAAGTRQVARGVAAALLSSLRNTGKPVVSRHLKLADCVYFWPNVSRPDGIVFRLEEEWKEEHRRYNEVLRGAIDQVEPGSISTGCGGSGSTMAEHMTGLPNEEDDAPLPWEVVEEGDGILRLSRMSEGPERYCDLYFKVDANRGYVVTEACSTPEGTGGPREESLTEYTSIGGVTLPKTYTSRKMDAAGTLIEEREVVFENYEIGDTERNFSLLDLELAPETVFTRSLPDLRAPGGRYKLEGESLVQITETEQP